MHPEHLASGSLLPQSAQQGLLFLHFNMIPLPCVSSQMSQRLCATDSPHHGMRRACVYLQRLEVVAWESWQASGLAASVDAGNLSAYLLSELLNEDQTADEDVGICNVLLELLIVLAIPKLFQEIAHHLETHLQCSTRILWNYSSL